MSLCIIFSSLWYLIYSSILVYYLTVTTFVCLADIAMCTDRPLSKPWHFFFKYLLQLHLLLPEYAALFWHIFSIDLQLFFLAFDFCRFCVVILIFSSPPKRPMASDIKVFLSQSVSITLLPYLNTWERASISLFDVECYPTVLLVLLVPFIFKTALVWRALWLGIVPGDSRTRTFYTELTIILSNKRVKTFSLSFSF